MEFKRENLEGPVEFEPTTPGLKGASAFLTGSQRRLDTKSAHFEPPRYLFFRQSGSAIPRPADPRTLRVPISAKCIDRSTKRLYTGRIACRRLVTLCLEGLGPAIHI